MKFSGNGLCLDDILVTISMIVSLVTFVVGVSLASCVQTDEPVPTWTTIQVQVELSFEAYQAKEGTCSDTVEFLDTTGDGWCTVEDIDEVMAGGAVVLDTALDGNTLTVTVEVYADTWSDFHVYESGGTLYLGRQVENQSEVNIADAMDLLLDHSYFDLVGFQADTNVTTWMTGDAWVAEVVGGDAGGVEVVETKDIGGIASPVLVVPQKYVFVGYEPAE